MFFWFPTATWRLKLAFENRRTQPPPTPTFVWNRCWFESLGESWPVTQPAIESTVLQPDWFGSTCTWSRWLESTFGSADATAAKVSIPRATTSAATSLFVTFFLPVSRGFREFLQAAAMPIGPRQTDRRPPVRRDATLAAGTGVKQL